MLSPRALTPSELARKVEIVPSEVKITLSTTFRVTAVALSPTVVTLVSWAVMLPLELATRPGPALAIVVTPFDRRVMSAPPIVPRLTGPSETKPSASVTVSGSVEPMTLTVPLPGGGGVGAGTAGVQSINPPGKLMQTLCATAAGVNIGTAPIRAGSATPNARAFLPLLDIKPVLDIAFILLGISNSAKC